MFCELAVTKCRSLRCIKLTTKKDGRPESEQIKGLSQLTVSLKEHNVNLIVEYVENLHDRQVMWVFKIIVLVFRFLISQFAGFPMAL